jgi:hypothetical protein
MKKHKNRKEEERAKTTKQHEKKSYVQPKLTEYGSVEKLTQGATGNTRDLATRKLP